MDGARFDRLTRDLGTPRRERGVPKLLGGVALGGLVQAVGRGAGEAASCTKGGGACGPTKAACCKGYACTDGFCVAPCAPNCSGKTCGADGCGGSCGACSDGQGCTDLATTSNCGA